MKEEATLKEYIKGTKLDIEEMLDEYYGYVYMVVKNTKSIAITEEDVEEIVSDVFLAMWKNYQNLKDNTRVKPYLVGITRNMIKNKYRMTKLESSITDYEEQLMISHTIETIAEENEQNEMIKNALKLLKIDEYQIFIAFYYENKKIKEIAKDLNFSESKVKVVLHRIRKELKKKLKNGGYSYERE